MVFLKSPELLQLSGDVAKTWRLFKQKLELFLTASVTGGKSMPAPTKTALLLSIARDDALDVYNYFVFSVDEDRQDCATIVGKFDGYLAAQLNKVHEIFLFCRRVQEQGEPAEKFIRDLR
uniref:Putative transposase n=1 Tax=Ixodes ricinus TaxID=34613 RepID=A0A0K8RK54_IXORI